MLRDPEHIITAALKRILADHDQYRRADTAGRANIRRNIRLRLQELHTDGNADQLIANYKRAFER